MARISSNSRSSPRTVSGRPRAAEPERAALESVSVEPLRNRAVAALRQAIVSGHLLPGTRLVEVSLAEELGVSRGTLREALRELERDGFVTSSPYRGTHVAEATTNLVPDTYALCGLLEGYAATLLSDDDRSAVVATQRTHLDRMRLALAEGRSTDLAAIDVDFHTVTCAAAGNRRLLQTWESLLPVPLQAFYAHQVTTLYTPREIIDRHVEVMTLLEASDPASIETGIRAHYLETARRMVAAIESIKPPATPAAASRRGRAAERDGA